MAKRRSGSHRPGHASERVYNEANEEPLGMVVVTRERCKESRMWLKNAGVEIFVAISW